MARLHNPGPGEILDRLSILQLKMLYGVQAGKPIGHFVSEAEALWSLLPGIGDYAREVIRLTAINAALWHAENDLRALRAAVGAGDDPKLLSHDEIVRAVRGAFQIQALNDQRAAGIATINRAAGRPEEAEKL